jgi:hypothetical protein
MYQVTAISGISQIGFGEGETLDDAQIECFLSMGNYVPANYTYKILHVSEIQTVEQIIERFNLEFDRTYDDTLKSCLLEFLYHSDSIIRETELGLEYFPTRILNNI